MANQISTALAKRNKKVASFAREIGVNPQTLYNIVKNDSVDNVTISIFIQIADGLGMTVEELYYGTPPKQPTYSDMRQTALNGYFESMNDTGKNTLVSSAQLMAGSPEVRLEKNNGEHIPLQTAMGA